MTPGVADIASRVRVSVLLCGLVTAAALVTPKAARAEAVADWQPFVAEASRRFGVPVAWIDRVMQAESRGRRTIAGRPITSSAGAMGLMQLMPPTWTMLRAALGLGADPYDPHDNILAGTAYLRMLYDRFGYPGLFAAYNAGPARYAAHLVTGRALPVETRRYVAAIRARAPVVLEAPAQTPASALFVAPSASARPVSGEQSVVPAPGMFVALSRP